MDEPTLHFRTSIVCPGRPYIRSTLTFTISAARAQRTASRISCEVWMRPMRFRIASSKTCAPMLTRFTPSVDSMVIVSRVTVPGFASTVNSKSSVVGMAACAVWMMRASNGTGSAVGVPPPM